MLADLTARRLTAGMAGRGRVVRTAGEPAVASQRLSAGGEVRWHSPDDQAAADRSALALGGRASDVTVAAT